MILNFFYWSSAGFLLVLISSFVHFPANTYQFLHQARTMQSLIYLKNFVKVSMTAK